MWHVLSVHSSPAPFFFHLQLKPLSGHQQAKNNPHLPTTQEKPFEVVGVFPLPSSPPLSQDTAFWTWKEGTSKATSGGIEQRRRMGRGRGETSRADEWEGKGEKKQVAWLLLLHSVSYVIFSPFISAHHLLSLLFSSAFTAHQLLAGIKADQRSEKNWKCTTWMWLWSISLKWRWIIFIFNT